MNDLLKDYPVIVDIPVAWGDMDAFQHVNNTVYFRWVETARIAYFSRVGMDASMKKDGIGPILHSTSCRFRVPLTYPDTVSVGARVTGMDEDRFTIETAIVSEQHARIAAEAQAIIVMFNYRTGGKTPIPASIRHRIAELEAGRRP